MSSTRKWGAVFAWFLYLLILLELFAFLSSRFVPKISQFFYDYGSMSESEYAEYLDKRNPVLGWPAPNDDFASNGYEPRMPPRFETPCVSVYGDSFTYSDGVDGESSWPYLASDSLNCDVLNFGIGGYGTYQTYLRFRENAPYDEGRIVVLNHMSENISRVRNQYRSLLYQGNIEGYKPVAVADGSTLTYVAPPTFDSYADYQEAMKNPTARHFPHEAYLPDSGFANFRREFPFTLSLANAVLHHYKVETMLFNTPMYEFHYGNPDDVELVLRIMQAFAAEAEKNSRIPLIALVPKCNDYEFLEREGRFTYSPLSDALEDSGMEYFDFGEAIRKRDDFASFHDWYGPKCGGHPNEAGYRVMAEVFSEYMQESGHVDPKSGELPVE